MARVYNRDESLGLQDKALRAVGKKHDVKIFNMRILILNGQDVKAPKANDIGIKVWGMIDGLCNYHGYRQHFVDNFKSKV